MRTYFYLFICAISLFIFSVKSNYFQSYEINVAVPVDDPILYNLPNATMNYSIEMFTNIFDNNRLTYYINPNGMIMFILNPQLTFQLIFNISI